MNKEVKKNIITLIELEAEVVPTVFSMYKSEEKECIINEIYDVTLANGDYSVKRAIYELEQRYGD